MNFRLTGRTLAIAEMQYADPSLDTMLYADQAEPMPRVYKLGFWYDGQNFADQRWDNTGLSLADPNSSGTPASHRGNFAVYAVGDQMIWQQADEPDRSMSAFLRVMGTPLKNRNLIDFSLNAGITVKEPIKERDDDTFGIGLGYAHVSGQAAEADRDPQAFGGGYTPSRNGETFVEVPYQYQMAPWWQIQPDFQYVFNVGAGVANPNSPDQRVKDEAVFGVRTNILF